MQTNTDKLATKHHGSVCSKLPHKTKLGVLQQKSSTYPKGDDLFYSAQTTARWDGTLSSDAMLSGRTSTAEDIKGKARAAPPSDCPCRPWSSSFSRPLFSELSQCLSPSAPPQCHGIASSPAHQSCHHCLTDPHRASTLNLIVLPCPQSHPAKCQAWFNPMMLFVFFRDLGF